MYVEQSSIEGSDLGMELLRSFVREEEIKVCLDELQILNYGKNNVD